MNGKEGEILSSKVDGMIELLVDFKNCLNYVQQ